MHTESEGSDGRKTISVVLLIDALRQPRWVAESVIAMLDNPEDVTISGIVLNGKADSVMGAVRRRLPDRLVNAWRKRDKVALERFLQFDAKRYPAGSADPFEEVDMTSALAQIPRHVAQPRQTAFSDFFDDPTMEYIRAIAPDVAVRFGFRILRGPVLSIPTHGVWSFHHGDNMVNRGGPAGFWEVLLGWPATGALLQRLSEDLDGGSTLARTWVATNPVSVHQNRATLYPAAAPLLLRKLRQLRQRGPIALTPPHGEPAFLPYSNRLYFTPSLRELTTGLTNVFKRLANRKVTFMRTREQWQLAYAYDAKRPADNEIPQAAAFRFKAIEPPADRFWADPCAVHHDGRTFVFFEELLYSNEKGRIAVIELGPSGPIGAPRVVLEQDTHLSYPFVFSHDGAWYMMPEMFETGRQEIFRATAFPDRWELFSHVDLGAPVVDATLHRDGDLWWLFAGTRPSEQSECNELSLWFGDSPLGPWTPHPANPVVSDARSARPAGRLFRMGGELIRPAQDGTPVYGSAIAFRRVARLDRETYAEEPSGRMEPNWDASLVGTHTITASGPHTVIDLRRRVPKAR